MVNLRESAKAYEDKSIKIEATQGIFFLINESDYELISNYKWFASKGNKTYYIYSHPKKKDKPIALHRLILGVNNKQIVDHIDGNGLNNLRNNLRFCSHGQNKANLHLYNNNTSGYRGVCFDKTRNKWMAKIKFNGKLINLGRFNNKIDAVLAYQNKSKELFGEFTYPISTQLNLMEDNKNGNTTTELRLEDRNNR